MSIPVRRPCRDAKSVLTNSGGYAALHHRLISGRPSGTQTHLFTCGETNGISDLNNDQKAC
jgi:hypothetical protein